MGIPGALAMMPDYLQNQLGHSNQGVANQGVANRECANYYNQQLQAYSNQQARLSMSGLETKVTEKIREAIAQLPMRICARVAHIQFHQTGNDGSMRFIVLFDNLHTLEFFDVDAFPAPEHIARIALECP